MKQNLRDEGVKPQRFGVFYSSGVIETDARAKSTETFLVNTAFAFAGA